MTSGFSCLRGLSCRTPISVASLLLALARGKLLPSGKSQLIGTLANYCQEHGSFSRRTVERLFGISRYRAQQLLDKLVDGPTAKFYRERFGTSYVYRRFGT